MSGGYNNNNYNANQGSGGVPSSGYAQPDVQQQYQMYQMMLQQQQMYLQQQQQQQQQGVSPQTGYGAVADQRVPSNYQMSGEDPRMLYQQGRGGSGEGYGVPSSSYGSYRGGDSYRGRGGEGYQGYRGRGGDMAGGYQGYRSSYQGAEGDATGYQGGYRGRGGDYQSGYQGYRSSYQGAAGDATGYQGGYRGRGGDYQGYRGDGGYRGRGEGGRGNYHGRGSASYHQGAPQGGKEHNFIIHVTDFERLNTIGRSGDYHDAISAVATEKIARITRGGATAAHLLFIVDGKYLGGFTRMASYTGERTQMNILSKEISMRFTDISETLTDQGCAFYGSTMDGDGMTRHFYLSLKQIILNVEPYVLQSIRGDVAPEGINILSFPVEQVVERMTSSIAMYDLVVAHAAMSEHSDESHSFMMNIVENHIAFLSATSGLRLFAEMLRYQRLRDSIFGKLQAFVKELCEAIATNERNGVEAPNMLEHPGFALFKLFVGHALSAPIVLRLFSVLPSEVVNPRVGANDAEVSIFCDAFGVFGYDAVCGNLASATFAALLGRFTPPRQLAGQEASRKRSREDDTDAAVPTSDKSDDAVKLRYRRELVVAATMCFTVGKDDARRDTRIGGLARHVLACRTVQALARPLLSAISSLPGPLRSISQDALENTFEGKALSLIVSLCTNAGTLMSDNYGNYVMQTLVTELASSVASAPADSSNVFTELIENMQLVVEKMFVDVACNKCGSNSVEKYIASTASLPPGLRESTVVSLAQCVSRLHPNEVIMISTHNYGNYVLKQLLYRLTSVVMTASQQEWKDKAAAEEATLYNILKSSYAQLQATSYGTGIVQWMTQQGGRLERRQPGTA